MTITEEVFIPPRSDAPFLTAPVEVWSPAPAAVAVEQSSRWNRFTSAILRRPGRLAGVAGLAILAGAGSIVGGSVGGRHEVPAAYAGTPTSGEAPGCDGVDQYAVTPASPSVYGPMYTRSSSGTEEDFSPSEASDQIMGVSCKYLGPLAVMDTFYDIYTSQATAPQDVGMAIELKYNDLKNSTSAQVTAENDVLNFANKLTAYTPNHAFLINSGASEVTASNNGDVLNVGPANLPSGQVDGWYVAYNAQQTGGSLTAQRYANLGEQIAIDVDGNVVLNNTQSTISFSEQGTPEATLSNLPPVTIPPAPSSTEVTSPQSSTGSSPNPNQPTFTAGTVTGGGTRSSGTTRNGQGTGGRGISSGGSSPEAAPGGTTLTPGGPGPGTTGPSGTSPNTTPGTTLGTAPERTTTPTTHPTTPSTTKPPVVVTTTTQPAGEKNPISTNTSLPGITQGAPF